MVDYRGGIIKAVRGNTRSLDYSSDRGNKNLGFWF